ncbi:MAG: XRE family transcriptional regulator [Oscillospiraceae bacterium]|nr:XRE family transcriptional regulator [Oscillospiraceae bacterium]
MRHRANNQRDDLNPFLRKIKSVLIERDISASHLSVLAGLGSSTLSNLLKRNNVPTIPTLMRVCAVLGVRLSDFIRDLEDSYPEIFLEANSGVQRYDPLSRRKQQLIADWSALPVSDQGETLRRMRETYAGNDGDEDEKK